jgi:hypothetical protein
MSAAKRRQSTTCTKQQQEPRGRSSRAPETWVRGLEDGDLKALGAVVAAEMERRAEFYRRANIQKYAAAVPVIGAA